MAESTDELVAQRRFFKAASHEVGASRGWFKNVLLLGLLNFVPIFGAMTVNGYAWGWGRRAAWKDRAPLPSKIYGRPGSHMLLWGWYVLVITFVYMLVPDIVWRIGQNLSDGGAVGSGLLLQIVGIAGMCLMSVLSLAACAHMMVWGRLGAGFDFKRVRELVGHDSKGLWGIFGWELLSGIVIAVVCCAVYGILALIFVGSASVLLTAATSTAGIGYGVMRLVFAALPAVAVVAYLFSCMVAWLSIVAARATGHWFSQFDVARWDGVPPLDGGAANGSEQSEDRPGNDQPESGQPSSLPAGEGDEEAGQ